MNQQTREIKRFDLLARCDGSLDMREHDNGGYVLASDHDARVAELTRENAKLRREIATAKALQEDAEAYADNRERHTALVAKGGEKLLERISDLERQLAYVYDGYAVLSALTPQARQRTSGENVADTLDALAKLQKAARAGEGS